MTENRFIQSADEQGYCQIKDTVTGETTQKYDDTACTWLNELNKENQKLKKVIQAQKQIIDKQEMKLAEYNNQINVSTN